jgi:hypothetical protein
MTRIDDRTPSSPAVNLRQTIEQLIADAETSKTANQVLVRALARRTAVHEILTTWNTRLNPTLTLHTTSLPTRSGLS